MTMPPQNSFSVLLFIVFAISVIRRAETLAPPTRYELVFAKAQLESANAAFIGPGAFFRISGDPPVLNALIPLIRDLPANTNTSWKCFTKIRNDWKETLIKGSLSFCDLLTSPIPAYKAVYSTSNLPPNCPVLKDNYTISDFKFGYNSKAMPAVIMGTDWRVRNWWTTGSTLIMRYSLELKVKSDK